MYFQLMLGSLLVLGQSVSVREQRMAELQVFSKKLTAIIMQQRIPELVDALDYEVTVDLEKERSTAALTKELQKKGEIYCRIFNTACARKVDGPKFLCVRDILIQKKAKLRTTIRFYKDIGIEDLEFAYITYTWGQDPAKYGWHAGVMVEMERLGSGWKIRSLFPLHY